MSPFFIPFLGSFSTTFLLPEILEKVYPFFHLLPYILPKIGVQNEQECRIQPCLTDQQENSALSQKR